MRTRDTGTSYETSDEMRAGTRTQGLAHSVQGFRKYENERTRAEVVRSRRGWGKWVLSRLHVTTIATR